MNSSLFFVYRVLFTWELIERYLDLFKRSTSVSYQAFWESSVEVYLRNGAIKLDELQKIVNLRRYFQDAVVSYIILLHIDWRSMVCSCGGKDGITVDGTHVAYQSLASLLSQPWRVPLFPMRKPETDPAHLSFIAGAPSKILDLLIKFVLVHRRRDERKKKKHL